MGLVIEVGMVIRGVCGQLKVDVVQGGLWSVRGVW